MVTTGGPGNDSSVFVVMETDCPKPHPLSAFTNTMYSVAGVKPIHTDNRLLHSTLNA